VKDHNRLYAEAHGYSGTGIRPITPSRSDDLEQPASLLELYTHSPC
jgi:hypothetical protein